MLRELCKGYGGMFQEKEIILCFEFGENILCTMSRVEHIHIHRFFFLCVCSVQCGKSSSKIKQEIFFRWNKEQRRIKKTCTKTTDRWRLRDKTNGEGDLIK